MKKVLICQAAFSAGGRLYEKGDEIEFAAQEDARKHIEAGLVREEPRPHPEDEAAGKAAAKVAAPSEKKAGSKKK